ncbi:MAG: putative E3 ubiquitin-protein ligase makorin-2 [Cirrosporium novae-zelandiae]|nr:MAG: putative E3 ubiquitin-protein ligase makorin-2 [Cirrosporium novae-zelandiae]
MEQLDHLPSMLSNQPQSPLEHIPTYDPPDLSNLSLDQAPQGYPHARPPHVNQSNTNIPAAQMSSLRANQNGHSQNNIPPSMAFGKSGRSRPRSIPSAAHLDRGLNGHGHFRPGIGMPAPFEHRSPPNKNLSHVPCRFFKQGNCQAGKACPFSHETDADLANQPCKYFNKGTCKYGVNCANAHFLPDGRRVPTRGPGNNGPGGRHPFLQEQLPTTSLLTQQANGTVTPTGPYSSFPMPSDDQFSPLGNYNGAYLDPFQADNDISSPKLGSMYGSPTEDNLFPKSPRGPLTIAQDAPFPASFDSHGVSRIWREGPIAQSMPSKFGMFPSSVSQKSPFGSDAIKNLHESAFGVESKNRSALGSSPFTEADDALAQKVFHAKRFQRLDHISSSVPRSSLSRFALSDDEHNGRNSPLEEDLVPSDLHDEVLTPQERMRRFSRNGQDVGRDDVSGYGSPVGSFGKVGSPISSSPSRFAPLFARQQQKRQEENTNTPSPFGHIGSPLRNSSLNFGLIPAMTSTARSTSDDASSLHFSKSPRQSAQSMLSQQLHQARLGGRSESSENSNGARPGVNRHPSNASSRLDRTISSSSITGGRQDEEQSDMLFSMDQEEGAKAKWATGVKSPDFGPIGGSRSSSGNHGPKELKASEARFGLLQ